MVWRMSKLTNFYFFYLCILRTHFSGVCVMYVYVHVFICCLTIYVYVCVYVYVFACLCVHMCMYMYLCVCSVCICACVCVCTHVNVCNFCVRLTNVSLLYLLDFFLIINFPFLSLAIIFP